MASAKRFIKQNIKKHHFLMIHHLQFYTFCQNECHRSQMNPKLNPILDDLMIHHPLHHQLTGIEFALCAEVAEEATILSSKFGLKFHTQSAKVAKKLSI